MNLFLSDRRIGTGIHINEITFAFLRSYQKIDLFLSNNQKSNTGFSFAENDAE